MAVMIDNNELAVIWSSSDLDVAETAVFTYTLNAKCRKWWDDVHLVVWGPSAKLLAANTDLQQKVQEMMEAGVKVCACKENADLYGVSDILGMLGISVKPMGEPVTELIKRGSRIITF